MPNFLIDQLAEALGDIADRRATCLMRVSTKNGHRMAFFEDGDLVYFASDDVRERLDAFLTADGRLDTARERADVAALALPNRPLAAQVIEHGVCDVDRLGPWIVEYAHECFARAFDDRHGAMKVMPGVRATHPVPIRVGARAVALESVRRMADAVLIREAVGPDTWTVSPTPDHMERLFSLPLNYQEGTLGSQLTTCMSIKDLVAVSDLSESEALRAILALRVSGVFAPFEEPKEMTDTGRLRMRQAALDAGVAVDTEAAAVALGSMAMAGVDAPAGDGPLAMREFESTQTWTVTPITPSERSRPDAETGQAAGRPQRAGSGQLRVLASVYVQMAEVEAASGNFNGAVNFFETALGQKPGDLTVVMPFAKYLLSFDRPQTRDAAERMLKQACVTNPTAVEPRIQLVRIFRASGRPALAVEALAEAERLAPNDPEVRTLVDGKAPRGGGSLFGRLRGNA
jgi:hypothetical protein